MPVLAITINRLKIIDCADDDEDMNIRLRVFIEHAGKEERLYSRAYEDVYVEEEGKIGNDSKCIFFPGDRINPHQADRVWIDVDLETLDGDGLGWNGHHIHTKNAHALSQGDNHFRERKEHSSNPASEGVYELDYTINRQ
jgi:hypothetical protein